MIFVLLICLIICQGAKAYTTFTESLRLRSHRGSRLLSLDVVHVQVLLQVEVRELVLLLEVQQLQQRGVTVDVVLVLQVLLLHVRRDELRHVGAGLLGAGGATHEGAQGRGDVGGDLEDGDARRLALLALYHLAAAALVGHLLQLGRLLLHALGLADELRHRLAHRQQARRQRLGLRLEAYLLRYYGRHLTRGRGSHHRGRGSRHGGSHGRRSHRGRSLLRGLRGLGGLSHGGSHHSYRGNYGLFGLLRHYTLYGGLRGGGSRAHYTRGGGRSRGHFTQD